MNTKPWPILTEAGLDTAALPTPLRARKPWHYTVGDVFALPPEQCAAAFGVMAATPQHRYTVEAGPGAAEWFEWLATWDGYGDRHPSDLRNCHAAMCNTDAPWQRKYELEGPPSGDEWPLPNVHLSTPECSTQAEIDERAPWVLRCPAAARVLRLVPTEGLDVRNALADRWECACPGGALDSLVCDDRNGCPMCPRCGFKLGGDGRPRFDLVTLRGTTAPVHPDWVRSVRDQCAVAGVAFRFGGWGDFLPVEQMTDEQYAALDACDAGLVDFGQRPWGESGPCVYAMRRGRSGRLLDGVTHDGEVPTC